MTERPNERVAYFNGEIVPESRIAISFRDRGFKLGDAAFDTSRTFAGRIFRLEAHVERLYRTLNYLRIDPGLSPAEMIAITHDVLERNRPFLADDGDYWVSQRISRGEDKVGGDIHEHAGGPTVIVECTPLPLPAPGPVCSSTASGWSHPRSAGPSRARSAPTPRPTTT